MKEEEEGRIYKDERGNDYYIPEKGEKFTKIVFAQNQDLYEMVYKLQIQFKILLVVFFMVVAIDLIVFWNVAFKNP